MHDAFGAFWRYQEGSPEMKGCSPDLRRPACGCDGSATHPSGSWVLAGRRRRCRPAKAARRRAARCRSPGSRESRRQRGGRWACGVGQRRRHVIFSSSCCSAQQGEGGGKHTACSQRAKSTAAGQRPQQQPTHSAMHIGGPGAGPGAGPGPGPGEGPPGLVPGAGAGEGLAGAGDGPNGEGDCT
jgi:hypothetical protein